MDGSLVFCPRWTGRRLAFSLPASVLYKTSPGRKRSTLHLLRISSKKVLHHPDFDADVVDHDIHERLMAAIEEGDLEVIDLKEDGDGEQDVRLFKRPAGKVLRSCWLIQGWQGASTLPSRSTRTQEALESLAATQMVQCPFNWPRSGLVQTLFPFP